jgi:hypothetical protein
MAFYGRIPLDQKFTVHPICEFDAIPRVHGAICGASGDDHDFPFYPPQQSQETHQTTRRFSALCACPRIPGQKGAGRLIYFGKVANDPKGETALNLWLDQNDELLAGRTPRSTPDGLTVRDLCNHFLTALLYVYAHAMTARRVASSRSSHGLNNRLKMGV